ncbi:MAG: glutamate formimidoyltransferase [Clostridiales bacterium]|nr:glutamate formimidoyltransferase [Clostridiales bacterium]MDD7035851.1 glutamate formimidoyltransferase [Bacillota bacterium]MDY2920091.1 glutamate formimidoyltransferase [Lentihominibacter sp.]
MAKIIESVPNISEGRNREVIEACVDQIRNTPGCTLLDYSSDETHNRSVITYMGSPEACEEASVKLAKKAVELIDLTKHEGGHPRMGCVDVMPFIPIKDATTEDCDELAKKVGARIAEEADLPVFLYEDSASAPHRKNLAKIRKGQFEGMAEKVKEDKWIPDFGGQRIHPTGGVVAVGARPPLIAFNINLGTDDEGIAKKIANIIREVKGGFKCVKAMGLLLEDRNVAQVSINMTDFRVTPLHRVLELVRREAARYGVNVIGTEIIGLAPMQAFLDAADYYLQIEDFDPDVQVIENHLL